jgi:hypothetical protein
MPIPTGVKTQLISGLPGELAFDGPTRAITALINTTDQTNNLFGRVFTYVDETIETVAAGGTGDFAGILINPKAYGIGPNGVAPNWTSAEFLQMGEVYVQLAAAATINDVVYYVQATGEIGVGAPGAGQTAIPNARVVRHVSSTETPRLAVVRLTN